MSYNFIFYNNHHKKLNDNVETIPAIAPINFGENGEESMSAHPEIITPPDKVALII